MLLLAGVDELQHQAIEKVQIGASPLMVQLAEGGLEICPNQTSSKTSWRFSRPSTRRRSNISFRYVLLQQIAASNSDVLRSMNKTPLFWLTVESAMLLSTFMALGRIFDQRSPHNVDRLIAIGKEVSTFSREALAARRRAAPGGPFG